MPAASWRIMPARSISRCETISASFGFSFRMGRKNRDNRMARLGNRGKAKGAPRSNRIGPENTRAAAWRYPRLPDQKACSLHLHSRMLMLLASRACTGTARAPGSGGANMEGRLDLASLLEAKRHRQHLAFLERRFQ